MAFDFGLRQIGVAVGNTQLRSAQPLAVIRAREGVPDWQTLERLVGEWRPDLLVVGDPLNMDCSDSELCARARRFARRLHGRLGLPVELVDERLTSFEAKQNSRQLGHRGDYKRRPVDSQAAELILRSWLGGLDTSAG
jgi:putative Holliday junction resolvase